MVELLSKYKINIDHKSLDGWSNGNNPIITWDIDLVDNYIPAFHHIQNISALQVIKRRMLEVGKTYHLIFDIKFGTGYNSFCISMGTNNTGQIQVDGHYDFYITSTENDLSIVANITTECWLYNVIIEEVGFTSLELFPDVDILLNESVKEVKEYGQNKDSYTRQFNLPGTPINNIFFRNIFNINEDSLYDINQKSDASIVIDDITIKNGIIKLDEIINIGDNYNYTITFYGDLVGLFISAGEKLLSELDYSDINHTIDPLSMIYSWNFPGMIGTYSYDKYTYPYMCYGNSPFKGIRGSALDEEGCGLLVSDIFPSISKQYLFNKCLTSLGYSYESSVIDSNEFKEFVINYTNPEENLNQWYKVARMDYVAGENKFYTMSLDYNNGYPNINLYPVGDDMGKYNSGYGSLSTLQDGIISKFWEAGGSIRYCTPIKTLDVLYGWDIQDNFYIYENTKQELNNIIPGTYRCRKKGSYKMKMRIKNSGYRIMMFATQIPKSSVSCISITPQFPPGSLPISSFSVSSEKITWIKNLNNISPTDYWYNNDGLWVDIESPVLLCDEDDLIAFKYFGNGAGWGEIEYLEIYELGYGNGSYVDFSKVVPENIKIKDFLSDMFNNFNLFVMTDKDNPKKLYIEDYNTFYGSGKKVEIKIDTSKPFKRIPPRDYSARQIQLKYKESDDTYNDYYNDRISSYGYGSKILKVNDFNEDDVKEIKSNIFAATVLKDFGININNSERQFIYSDISNFGYDDSPVTYKQNTKTTPRFNFFKLCDVNSTYKKFRFENYVLNEYPYCGHIEDPFNIDNSMDINFETITQYNNINALMFTPNPQGMTNRNLYNLYWRNYLNNYLDKSAGLVEVYADLSLFDIFNIRLNDTIQIGDMNYYINKIIDYNCSQQGLMTKIELLKIVDSLALYEEFVAMLNGQIPPNTAMVNRNINLGDNNSIALTAARSFVLGNSCNISDDCSGISITGNFCSIGTNCKNVVISASEKVIIGSNVNNCKIDNCSNVNITAGVENISISNTSDITVTQSNISIINNNQISDGNIPTYPDIIDGGLDGNYDNFGFEIDIFDGGENSEVGQDGSRWNIIDGGLDGSY